MFVRFWLDFFLSETWCCFPIRWNLLLKLNFCSGFCQNLGKTSESPHLLSHPNRPICPTKIFALWFIIYFCLLPFRDLVIWIYGIWYLFPFSREFERMHFCHLLLQLVSTGKTIWFFFARKLLCYYVTFFLCSSWLHSKIYFEKFHGLKIEKV